MMKKRGSSPNSGRGARASVTLGRKRFAKISAVEGIVLTPAAEKRAAAFDRKGLSPQERIRAIVAAHRKG